LAGCKVENSQFHREFSLFQQPGKGPFKTSVLKNAPQFINTENGEKRFFMFA
jgi:hypothetical protein